jgi:UDP-2-acetamido-3-amino-2,3-dideoxy-glucuronate N-acetyltransferase
MNKNWHTSSDIHSKSIGVNTRIWQYVVILQGAKIGKDVNICSHCFIENDVSVGDRTTIKSGVQLWDGISVGSDVFIGPNVTFTNDKFPKSKFYPVEFLKTIIEDGVSIGANSTILPGIKIGKNSLIGAGSVVTKSVPPNSIVCGNPSRYITKAKCNDFHKSRLDLDYLDSNPIPTFKDKRGALSVSDFDALIPFDVKRFFIVYATDKGTERGGHAHYVCHQYLICTSGSVLVTIDNGKDKKNILLNSPDKGLYIPPMIWGTQIYKTTYTSLMVFASHSYDSKDYISTYPDYIKAIK